MEALLAIVQNPSHNGSIIPKHFQWMLVISENPYWMRTRRKKDIYSSSLGSLTPCSCFFSFLLLFFCLAAHSGGLFVALPTNLEYSQLYSLLVTRYLFEDGLTGSLKRPGPQHLCRLLNPSLCSHSPETLPLPLLFLLTPLQSSPQSLLFKALTWSVEGWELSPTELSTEEPNTGALLSWAWWLTKGETQPRDAEQSLSQPGVSDSSHSQCLRYRISSHRT